MAESARWLRRAASALCLRLLSNFHNTILRWRKPAVALAKAGRGAGNLSRLIGGHAICSQSRRTCILKVFLYLWSGCRESNPVYLLPKQTYYRYTTPRICRPMLPKVKSLHSIQNFANLRQLAIQP